MARKKQQKKSSVKPAARRTQRRPKHAPKRASSARKPTAPTRARNVPNPPAGYPTLSPYLIVRGAARAIEFYVRALGARELYRLDMAGGKLGHAELVIGDSPFMLADEFPEMGFRSPLAHGGTPVSLLVYVPDCDRAVKKMVASGATLMRPVQDHFYGDRAGTVVDPFGHVWTLATHIEDVSPTEIIHRAKSLSGG